MGDERERNGATRRENEKVQEEIRRLFARYRQIARRAATRPHRRSPRRADGD